MTKRAKPTVILEVYFDSFDLSDFNYKLGIPYAFRIINPPTIPNTGEMVEFKWEDYIQDKELLQKIEKVKTEEEECFIAEIFKRAYSLNEVKVRLILHKSAAFRQHRKEGWI